MEQLPPQMRRIQVTAGNLSNSHIYLTELLKDGFFPDDCFGESRRDGVLGRKLSLELQGFDTEVRTDIPRQLTSGKPRKTFRKRSWVNQFFKKHKIRAGDWIVIERIDPYRYRIRPERAAPALVEALQPPRPVVKPANRLMLPPVRDAGELVARIRACDGLPEANLVQLVKEFLVRLGHPSGAIILELGRVDVLLQDRRARALATFEVKRQISTRGQQHKARRQAFDYAAQVDARYAIITDGDRFMIYDRHLPGTYDDMLAGAFQLTRFTEDMRAAVELLLPSAPGKRLRVGHR